MAPILLVMTPRNDNPPRRPTATTWASGRPLSFFVPSVSLVLSRQAPPTKEAEALLAEKATNVSARADNAYRFTDKTRCIIYGLQHRACQGRRNNDCSHA
jgi:hypothetical protein